MSTSDTLLTCFTSMFSEMTVIIMSIKATLATILEVNHNVMSVLLRLGVNFLGAIWAVLYFICIVVYTAVVCFIDFILELTNFVTAFLYLLWKILILVYSFMDLLFHSLECLVYFMWTGGKWTAETIQVSGQNFSDNGLSTWKYFVVSLNEFTGSVIGGFTTIGVSAKCLMVLVYDSLCLSYESVYEFLLYTDFCVRYVCRCCFESSYYFVTEYILRMPKEAYLGIVIICLGYIILRNVIYRMCSEGLTFPVTGWFNMNIVDEYESDYNEFDGDRDEFSDEDEEMVNYTVTGDDDDDENDEYSVNSDISDGSSDDDGSSDSDDELEIESDSDNDSNAASESEMSEINIELPQSDGGGFNFRRSTTPSRITSDMSADDLHKAVETDKERRMCVVCQDRSKSVLILPCRHMCLCVECGNHIARSRARERRKCPLCRSKINTIMNVYL